MTEKDIRPATASTPLSSFGPSTSRLQKKYKNVIDMVRDLIDDDEFVNELERRIENSSYKKSLEKLMIKYPEIKESKYRVIITSDSARISFMTKVIIHFRRLFRRK